MVAPQKDQIQVWTRRESISLRNFTPVVREVSLQDFFIRFGRPTAKNSDSVVLTVVRPDGPNSRILTWRDYFALELYASSLESFPPVFFTHFVHPTDENYESVFLTSVRPKSMFGLFDRRATRKGLKNPRPRAGLVFQIQQNFFQNLPDIFKLT